MSPAERRRRPRALLAALALVAAAAAAVVALLFGGIDARRYRQDVAALVQRATGREFLLEGDLSLRMLPHPTLRVEAAKLANAAWGSRPWMLEAGLFEASVALWPLLRGRVEVEGVVVTNADLLLETSARGEPNWRFSRPDAGAEEAPATARPEGPAAALPGLREIVLREVRLAWRSGATGHTRTLDLDSLDLVAAEATAPVGIEAQGRLDETRFRLRGRGPSREALFRGEPVYAMEDLSLEMPLGDLAGKLVLSLAGERPRLDADLASKRLDLTRPPAAPRAPAGTGAAAKGGPLFSREALAWDALAAADAKLRLRVERFRATPDLELTGVETAAVLAGGALVVEPLAFDLAGGRAKGRIALAAAERSFRADLEASGVEVPRLLAELAGTRGLGGARSRARLELRGTGASAHALAASLQGHLSLVSGAGSFRVGFLDFLGPEVGSVLRPLVVGGREARFDCIALRFDVARGIARSRVLFGEGPHVALLGRGAIDLGRERIDVVVVPKRKVTELAALPVPLRIEGPLASPRTRTDATASVAAVVTDVGVRPVQELGGAVTSLLGLGRPLGEGMSCTAAVTIADGGEPPPASRASSVPKALGEKAGDAARRIGRGLKSLLPD